MNAAKRQKLPESVWKDAYERGDAVWEDTVPDTSVFAIDYIKTVMRIKNGRMLDLGCGAGNTTITFAESGAFGKVIAVDFVRQAIDKFKKRIYKKKLARIIDAYVSDITKYKINGNYNVINCMRVLQSFDYNTQALLMKQMQKHTASGGINIVMLPYTRGRYGLEKYVNPYERAGWQIVYEQARRPLHKFILLRKKKKKSKKRNLYILSVIARKQK